jgi:hypothetical protein
VNPSMTRRKAVVVVKTRGVYPSWDKSVGNLSNWADGGRRIEGVNLIQALAWNCGNQSFRCQGKSTSSRSYEAKYPKRNTGTDRPVGVMMAGNAAGAKGAGRAVALRTQLATGGGA